MIIAFGGRSRSGKSELAKICEGYGYKKLYFALPLKQMCASILEVSIDELNRLKNENIPLNITIDDDICKILSNETSIPLDAVKRICQGKLITNARQMLQFIGTDLIRTQYPNWHVDRIKEMILSSNEDKVVIDDVRFQNEKNMIESMGGDVWFVVRPTLENVSNHISETSLSWTDCYDKIIVNDSTLSYLLFRWDTFLKNYTLSKRLRDLEIEHIMKNGIHDGRYSMSMREMLLVSEDFFTYSEPNISEEDIASINQLANRSVYVRLNDGTCQVFTNSLIIEDIKKLIKNKNG